MYFISYTLCLLSMLNMFYIIPLVHTMDANNKMLLQKTFNACVKYVFKLRRIKSGIKSIDFLDKTFLLTWNIVTVSKYLNWLDPDYQIIFCWFSVSYVGSVFSQCYSTNSLVCWEKCVIRSWDRFVEFIASVCEVRRNRICISEGMC